MLKSLNVQTKLCECSGLKKHGGFEQDYVEDDVGEAIVMSLLEKQNDEKGLTTKIKKKLKEHRERVSRLSEISSFVLKLCILYIF